MNNTCHCPNTNHGLPHIHEDNVVHYYPCLSCHTPVQVGQVSLHCPQCGADLLWKYQPELLGRP